MDPIVRRKLYIDQPGARSLGQSLLAVVYCIRGAESFSVGSDPMVPDGIYPGQDGCETRKRLKLIMFEMEAPLVFRLLFKDNRFLT